MGIEIGIGEGVGTCMLKDDKSTSPKALVSSQVSPQDVHLLGAYFRGLTGANYLNVPIPALKRIW